MTDFPGFGFDPTSRVWKVPAVRRKLSITCLLLAWLCANGAVWNVVQVVGWVRMFHDYSQVMPAAEALELTFDGSAPCDLCEIAQEGQNATRDPQAPAAPGGGAEKILLIADCVPAPVLVAPAISWPGVANDAGLTRTEAVPVPPAARLTRTALHAAARRTRGVFVSPRPLGRVRTHAHFACTLFILPLKTRHKILLSLAILGGLTRAVLACDSCALYIAGGADRPGFTLAVAHQYTRLGTLWNGSAQTGNPIDQYVDSHITQLGVGYSTGGPWHLQLTVPHVDRAFFRPDHSRTERGRDRGLGDIVLAGRYRVWETTTRNGDEWDVHVLGGMKFGTGNADRLKPANHVHHHFVPSGVHEHDLALGSGSTDWLVGGDVSWTHGRWFARAQIQHELRRPGAFGYRFGDETSWELGAGRHLFLTDEKTLSLQALFSGDRRGLDSLGGIPQDDTGMNVRYLGGRVAGTFGSRFSADASVELPVRIRTTDVMVVPDYRIRAAVNWRF